MEFKDSGLYFIQGKSGSGKSTLLHLISGIIGGHSGSIDISNINVSCLSEKEWDLFRNQNIGIVFQNYNLIEEYSVYENIGLPLKILILYENL